MHKLIRKEAQARIATGVACDTEVVYISNKAREGQDEQY